MSTRVGRVRDASDGGRYSSHGVRQRRTQSRRDEVTPGRVNLLRTMVAERSSVFTPEEARHADQLLELLAGHERGVEMPMERWQRAFEWLKTINVEARQSSQDPRPTGQRSSVPLVVQELGQQEAMGVYETPDGDFYVVSQSRVNKDHTVARRIVEFNGDRLMLSGEHRDVRSVKEVGAVYRLQPQWKITPERALQFIEIVGRCPRCVGMGLSGRLRDGVSVEIGSGKTCSEAMGLGERYRQAQIAARAEQKAAASR